MTAEPTVLITTLNSLYQLIRKNGKELSLGNRSEVHNSVPGMLYFHRTAAADRPACLYVHGTPLRRKHKTWLTVGSSGERNRGTEG